MDLMSSTLNKYLKHRFNGNRNLNLERLPKTEEEPTITHRTPRINHILINKIQPCCVSLKDDLKYLAAGFENSHIYLWTSSSNNSAGTSSSATNSDGSQGDSHKLDKIYTLLAHTGPVYDIKFHNDNDLMLSCSEDTTIRLWCLKEKCNLFIYRGHNYPVWFLDIGPHGHSFASTSMDTTARLWRFDKMTPVRIFCGHDDDVECVKFHPNEKYVATGSSDSTIRLWSISDGRMVRLMVGHQNPIISLSFHSNGKFLSSASRDGIIKVWNLATNAVTNEYDSIPPSYTISISPDQIFVASCGMDNILRLYQIDEQSKLIEKRSLDYPTQETNLIKSQFHETSNKLIIVRYVINYNRRDTNKPSKTTMTNSKIK